MGKSKREMREKAYLEAYDRASKKGNYPDREHHIDFDTLEELGVGKYRAVEGDNFLRFLPRSDDPHEFFWLEVQVHYDIGVNGDSFLCLNRMRNERCPVCELAKQLEREGEDWRVVAPYRPTMRYLFWVIDALNDETINEGIQLYDAPKTVGKAVGGLAIDKRTRKVRFIDDLSSEDGAVVSFERKGQTKLGTSYEAFMLEEDIPLPGGIEEDIPEMSEILVWADYEDIAIALSGGDLDDSDVVDEDDEEFVDEGDDEEDLVDEEDDEVEEVVEDEEEDPQPRRRSSRSRSKESDSGPGPRRRSRGKSSRGSSTGEIVDRVQKRVRKSRSDD